MVRALLAIMTCEIIIAKKSLEGHSYSSRLARYHDIIDGFTLMLQNINLFVQAEAKITRVQFSWFQLPNKKKEKGLVNY